MANQIKHGDKITALGLSVTVDRVLYQDHFGDRPPFPGSDFWGYDIEFIDTRGDYHHWKQNQDGGTVSRWDGRSWQPIVPVPTMKKRHFPGYGLLEYIDPEEYFNGDDWQYESTEDCSSGTTWDIVSRKDAFPCMDCRYTTIER